MVTFTLSPCGLVLVGHASAVSWLSFMDKVIKSLGEKSIAAKPKAVSKEAILILRPY